MKNSLLVTSFIIAMLLTLTSCVAIGGIFKAGVWTGFIIVALVIAIIIYIVSRSSKK